MDLPRQPSTRRAALTGDLLAGREHTGPREHRSLERRKVHLSRSIETDDLRVVATVCVELRAAIGSLEKVLDQFCNEHGPWSPNRLTLFRERTLAILEDLEYMPVQAGTGHEENGMKAFGYIRVEDDDEALVESFHDQITKKASVEGYSIEEIFVDRRVAPQDLVRPAFQALTDKLAGEHVAHVLVPDLDHLSPLPTTRTALESKLGSIGSTVVHCGESSTR